MGRNRLGFHMIFMQKHDKGVYSIPITFLLLLLFYLKGKATSSKVLLFFGLTYIFQVDFFHVEKRIDASNGNQALNNRDYAKR